MEYVDELNKKLYQVITKFSSKYKDNVGVLVSGGIDSSTIAFYLTQTLKEKVKLFSFGTSNCPDIPYLRILEKFLNKKVQFLNLEKVDLNLYPKKIIKLLEKNNIPINLTQVSLATGYYLIFKEISSQAIKTVFTGQGPDVFLAGYFKYKSIDPKKGNLEIKKDYKMLEIDKKRDSLMAKEWEINLINPYFDKELIELFEKIPFEFKLKRKNGKLIEKYILRKVGESNKLPKEIIWRPKKGFQYSSHIQKKIKPYYKKIFSFK